MGTTWAVKVATDSLDGERRVALDRAIGDQLERVDSLMSHYRQDSEVSRFNAAGPGEPVEVSPETLEVVALAQEIAVMSGGAFDVTIAPLVDAWGFGPGPSPAAVPTDEAIAALLDRIGHDELVVDPARSTLAKRRESVSLDLSAIAKGYAVDRVARALEAQGVERYLVEIGGELRARGQNRRGEPWRVAIEKPRGGDEGSTRVIGLESGSVATSGEYRNFRIVEGRRVSHTIDPRTGRPVAHRLAAVSVVDTDCARADALATALNVLGPEDGWRLAVDHHLAALFQVASPSGDAFEDLATPAFEARFPSGIASDEAAR
jgi:thiamine biosynthesis lipoprotein